jgi:hypothetical protein
MEGKLQLQRVKNHVPAECTNACRSMMEDHLTGVAHLDHQATSLYALHELLEGLNGKNVRITVEWNP